MNDLIKLSQNEKVCGGFQIFEPVYCISRDKIGKVMGYFSEGEKIISYSLDFGEIWVSPRYKIFDRGDFQRKELKHLNDINLIEML